MLKHKKLYLVIGIGSLVLILGFLTWFLKVPFEAVKPSIKVEPLPEFLSGTKKFTLAASDMKSGLRLLSLRMELHWRANPVGRVRKNLPFFHQFTQES